MIESIACSKVIVKSNDLRWLTGPNVLSEITSTPGAVELKPIVVGFESGAGNCSRKKAVIRT